MPGRFLRGKLANRDGLPAPAGLGVDMRAAWPAREDAVLVPAHGRHGVGKPEGRPDQRNHDQQDGSIHQLPMAVIGIGLRRAGIGREIVLFRWRRLPRAGKGQDLMVVTGRLAFGHCYARTVA